MSIPTPKGGPGGLPLSLSEEGLGVERVGSDVSNILHHKEALTTLSLPARYKHIHSGKVRETYENPDDPSQLIIIATDRISTHDVVHIAGIPGKGEILTQVSNFWFKYFKTQDATRDIPTQVVSNFSFPSDFPSEFYDRTIVVKKLKALPVEAIVRARLYGSVVEEYNTYGTVTGISVEPGLLKGSEFREPLFTPSTKAPKGKHDLNVKFDLMVASLENWLAANGYDPSRARDYALQIEEYSKRMFETATQVAKAKRLIIADTKFEFALDEQGVLHLIDETLTPDSSRFWESVGYVAGDEPKSFDKEPVRQYAMREWTSMGKVEEKPPLTLPAHVIEETRVRYENLRRMFTVFEG